MRSSQKLTNADNLFLSQFKLLINAHDIEKAFLTWLFICKIYIAAEFGRKLLSNFGANLRPPNIQKRRICDYFCIVCIIGAFFPFGEATIGYVELKFYLKNTIYKN